MWKNKAKHDIAFTLCLIICAGWSLPVYAGAANPIGVNAANSFIGGHAPTMGGVKAGLLNNMPASAQSLQGASQAAHNARSNQTAIQNPQSTKYATNMLKSSSNQSGQCHVTDTRTYCEKATWFSAATRTQKIINFATPPPPSLALCQQYVSPPAGFTSANLVGATGNLGLFTGKVMCHYKITKSNALVKTFHAIWQPAHSFITPKYSSATIQFMSSTQPTQAQTNNQCYAQMRVGTTPGRSYVGGYLISW